MNQSLLVGTDRSLVWVPVLALLMCSAPTGCRAGPEDKWFLEGTYTDRELGEMTSDVVTASGVKIGEVDIPDVPQERLGVRFGVRSRDGGWHVQVFSEEFADLYDLAGVGFGGIGFAPFAGHEDELRWGLIWGTDIALAAGDGDVPVVDLSTGNVVGTVNQTLAYFELEGSLGLGLDVNGFRSSAGIAMSLLSGRFETDGGGDGGFSATNVGPYLGVEYISDDRPVTGRLRLIFGDLDGIMLGIGVRF